MLMNVQRREQEVLSSTNLSTPKLFWPNTTRIWLSLLPDPEFKIRGVLKNGAVT